LFWARKNPNLFRFGFCFYKKPANLLLFLQ